MIQNDPNIFSVFDLGVKALPLPGTRASSRIFAARQQRRAEPSRGACRGTELVQGMTWSETSVGHQVLVEPARL